MVKAKNNRTANVSALAFPKPTHKKKKRPGFTRPAGCYCQYCGSTYMIERHHITPKGMGGTWNPEIHSEANRIDLCAICHGKAQTYKPGYLIADLLNKKAEDENRQKTYGALVGAFNERPL
jgi:5-methylcytosine-specific restriction endonuclease McrA